MKNTLFVAVALLAVISLSAPAAHSLDLSGTTVSQESNTTNISEGTYYTLLALFHVNSSSHIPQDQIIVRCEFEGSACSGASASLKDDKGKVIERQVISSVQGLKFSLLKKKSYQVEIDYPRYQVSSISQAVSAGSEVLIKLEKKK